MRCKIIIYYNNLIKMADIEFIYNGIKTIIQCELNTKMKDICNDFKK